MAHMVVYHDRIVSHNLVVAAVDICNNHALNCNIGCYLTIQATKNN